jgi:DNA repair photolyase
MGVSNPIYVPQGPAAEYGELALNIYTGCPHRCFYCYAPSVLRLERETFHTAIAPRENIVEAVKKQLKKGKIKDKTIFLCFVCDPYPHGYDTSVTREIIEAIKDTGNFVNILTKNPVDALRDIDLFCSSDNFQKSDSFGITIDGTESDETIEQRLYCLYKAMVYGGADIWISFEPIILERVIFGVLESNHSALKSATLKFGKLNYTKNDINWHKVANKIVSICEAKGYKYTLKESLRKELNK